MSNALIIVPKWTAQLPGLYLGEIASVKWVGAHYRMCQNRNL